MKTFSLMSDKCEATCTICKCKILTGERRISICYSVKNSVGFYFTITTCESCAFFSAISNTDEEADLISGKWIVNGVLVMEY